MARKKTLKRKVIVPFKLRGNDGVKVYSIGDTFETTNKKSLEILEEQGKIDKK